MVTETNLEEAQSEVKRWKEIALYLADCHAATAEYDGQMKSVSQSRKDRYRSICEKALGMLREEIPPPHIHEQDVQERLWSAAKELKK